MSMYKTIFWSEEYADLSTDQSIQLTNGDALVFGQSAFATLDEAVAAAGNNAIVIKVASGKYDGFTVINEGVPMTDVSVIAVDFDGGEAMIGGESVTVADSGIAADAQASIIADLNDINAANGKIFVAADLAPASATTLYVGMGEAGYVAGAAATVVTGSNIDEIANVFIESVISKPVEATAVSNGIYVSNEYNSSTAGWGTTHFNNYSGAYAYATANNTNATIVIEKTNTLSGNCFDNTHKDYSKLAVLVKDGASIGDSLSKWDMTYAVTVEAGGKITAARPANASTSNIHIKNTLTLQGTSEKKAIFDLLSDSYADGDISLRYNGKIIAENAIIRVQDLDCQGAITLTDTEVTVDGAFATATSFLYKSTFTNCTINIGGTQISGGLSDFSGGSANQLGNTSLINTEMTFGAGSVVNVKSNINVKSGSKLSAGTLNIAKNNTIKMDSSCLLTLDSLTGDGKIELTLLDGFTGGKIIDITGATGLTEDILSKITIKGGDSKFALTIQEGDIYVMKGIGIKDGGLDLTENESETFTGTIGKAEEDLAITATGSEVTEKAEIKADVVGNDITLDNSKDLAVTGSIKAEGTATITNSGSNIYDEEGTLVAEAVINGGYDENGEEKAAKVEAETIIMQNDGHANVELSATKDIVVANNSVNTLTGTLTADEKIIVTADAVIVDGVSTNGEGRIEDATLTAGEITVGDQIVNGTSFETSTLKVYGETTLGADNSYTERSNIFLGSKENSVNATLDVTDDVFGNIVVGNGTVTLTGKMDETISQGSQLDVGGFLNPGGIGPKDIEMGSTTVNVAEGAYVKANQVYVGENDSVNDHTLNVYGKLDATASSFIKAKGELNVYGEMNVAEQKYLQASGDVTVSGANASLNVGGTSTYGIKIGTDEEGLRSTFTVEEGASVNVGTIVEVGYSTNRNGDLNVNSGNLSAASVKVQSGSNFTVTGESSLNIDSLSGNILVEGETTLTDSKIGSGNIYVGYNGYSDTEVKMNVAGDTFTAGTIYVGTDSEKHTLAIGDADAENKLSADVGSIYLRAKGELAVDNADLNIDYINHKGAASIDNSDVTIREWLIGNTKSEDIASVEVQNSTITQINNGGITVGYQAGANFTMSDSTMNLTYSGLTVNADSTFSMDNSTLTAGTVTNDGELTVSGESTLNIGTLTGSSIDLLDGAIIKDSTVGGNAFIAGNVTFRGDNSFSMITDFGNLTDYYGTTAPMQWTVEEGASLTLTTAARYGLGYGDKVTVNGTISEGGASAARATLSDDNAENDVKQSLFMHGLVAQESKGWDENSSFTVNNAYVTIGSNNSFGNKSGNYGGTYTFNINNSVVDSSRITFYEALSKTNFTFKDSDVKLGTFMTRDTDSVFTLDNTKLVSTTAANGTDEGNYNAGTLNITNGSDITYTAQLVNEGGSVNVDNSTFTANGGVKNNATFNVSGESTLNIATLSGNAIQVLDGANLKNSNVGGYVWIMENAAISGTNTIDGINLYGKEDAHLTVAEGATLTVTDLVLRDGSTMTVYGTVNGSGISTGGTVNIDGGSMTGYIENYHPDVEAEFNVTNNGTLTLTNSYKDITVNMDTTGSLVLSGMAYDNIELNLSGLTGSGLFGNYTIVDMTSNGNADVALTIDGASYEVGDKLEINGIVYSITDGDGNDIVLEASAKTLIVDPTYTEETPGYGFDKFSSFAEALQAAAENTEVQVIKVAGDIDEEIMPTDVEFLVNQDVVITADKPVSINLKNNGTSYDIILGANADASGSKITFDENISLTLNDRLIWAGYYGNNADVEIKGEVSASQWWNGADTTVKAGGKLSTTGEALIFRRGATLTVEGNAAQGAAAEDREVQLDANYLNFLSGNLIATDTRIESGAVWVANTGSYTNESSVWINLDNTILNSSGNLKLNSDATALMIVENGSTLNVTNFDGYGASEIGANGSLWVYDSTANLKDVNNAGDIDIADSTFNVNGTLNNTGIFNVSGSSTLKVNKLVGTLNVADATINDGSYIKGKAGSVDISGSEVNFDGNVTIDAAVNSNKSEDATTININEGAVVNINGKEYDKYNGGVNLGATDTLNVDGTLNVNQGDNFYLKATTNVAGELNVTDAGFQNTSGKLTVTGAMNVTDTFNDGAYQNIKLAGNDNASATGYLDVDGGTLSIDAPSFAFGGGYKSAGWVDVASADVTVQNGGKITSNAVVFRNGLNSTMTLDNGTFEFTEAPDFGTVHSTLGTEIDNLGTINASNGSTLDFSDRTFTNKGEISVSDSTINGGTIDNKGVFTVDNSTITLDRFEQNGTTGAVFNNVDLDVGYFYNGAVGGDYAVIGGESKLNIADASGYFALRLADDAVLLDGTNVTNITMRTQGDVTIGKEATDFIHLDSFDTRDSYDFDRANSQTITVNGTLDIAAAGKGYSAYWMGIYGSENANDASVATTLTGNGVINSNTAAILQYGKIVVDEGLTINVTDQYAADLRFTLTDITIKGEINSIGNNNKLNAIQTSTVTLTGENAALNLDGYLLVGYHTYKGNNDTTDKYKSTVTVSDGASLNVDGTLYINKSSSIMIDTDSTFSAGSIMNYGGMINSSKEGEVVITSNMTITGNVTTADLVLAQGAKLNASINVTNLTLAIGSELTLGANSVIGANYITVTGKLVPENAEFVLVTTGFSAAMQDKLVYFDLNGDGTIADTEKFTVQTDITNLAGLNFVTIDGNLYVKDFGAAESGIFIGDLSGAVNGKITAPNGAIYTVGENAFASVEDATEALGDNVSDVKTVALKSGDDIDATLSEIPTVETITIEDFAVIDVNDGNLIIRNDGHLDATITANDSMEITNTSKETLLGSYSSDYEITVNNEGGMIGEGTYGVEDATVFNTSSVIVNNGDAANVEVNAGTLELNNTNTFGLNADSGIFAGDNYGAGTIYLNGSANLSIDGDFAETSDVVINGYTDEHTGSVTFNGNQSYSGEISANKIIVADEKEVTLTSNVLDFNELNVAGTLNADFTSQGSFTSAGKLTGDGTFNSTHGGAWIVNDSVARDLSGFTGDVTMTNDNASIVMGKGDIDQSVDSYFSNDATVTIGSTQSVVLAGNGVTTGIDFNGEGAINVGNINASAGIVDSNDFAQTLNGDNSGFTGTVNVAEGAILTLESQINAASINMNATSEAATGNTDDTKLVLNVQDAAKNAVITGDANDVIDANADQTLTAAGALNSFSGTVELEANKLTLDGVNETAATITGTGTIDANKKLTLTGNEALNNFGGTVNLDANVVLKGENNTAAKFSGSKTLDVDANQIFSAEGALNELAGTLDIASGKSVTLTADNTVKAELSGSGDINLSDADLTVTGKMSSSSSNSSYTGNIAVDDNTLTFANSQGFAMYHGTVSGTADATFNSNAARVELFTEGALNNFNGSVNVADNATLTLKAANNTAADFAGSETAKLILGGSETTFSGNGALNDFEGTLQLNAPVNTFKLTGENNTAATITSMDSDVVIDADADQVFSGNLSGFTGTFDIADGAEVELSGTIADVINAKGDTLTLSNQNGIGITVNAAANADLDNLNFGSNNVTLGAGDGDDFTNVSGSGNIVDFGLDQNFDNITASAINVTGSEDALTIGNLAADVNIAIDAAQNDSKADVTVTGNFSGNINVTVADGSYLTNGYLLVSNSAFTSNSTIDLTVGNGFADDLKVDDIALIDGQAYLLQLKDNTLVLTKLPGYSNYVVVNGDWSSKVPYQSVDDNGTERIIGYNAAVDLDAAVSYIKGRPDGLDWGSETGDAMIELTEGKYTLTTGTLMTDDNGVTQLVLKGRDGEVVTLSGVIVGSDGSDETTLTLENVRIQGDIYGGGALVVNNANDVRSSGNVLAGGAYNADMSNNSSLTINGGYFGQRIMVGGSVNDSGSAITMDGDTLVVIDNKNDEKMVISSNIYGGSWAANGDVDQNGDANILINVEKATQIRGNIFVSGGASNGNSYTMNGDSIITFTGDASLLTFTGSVTGNINDPDNLTTEMMVFNNFDGTFNGFISGFDTITIAGSSSLELGRRQTQTANTEMTFDITGRDGRFSSVANSAMYTVRDANAWEFSTNIVVNAADNRYDGYDYVLVGNYAGDFSEFTYTVAGNSNYNIGEWTYDTNGAAYKLYVNDSNQLVLDYVSAANNVIVSDDNDNLEIENAKMLTIGDGITAQTSDALNLVDVTLGAGASLEVSSNNRNLSNVTLGNGSTLTLNTGSQSGTVDNLNMQVANAGDTATVIWSGDSNWDYAAGYTIGEGVTLDMEKTVMNGAPVQIDGTLDSDYLYMLDGEATVTGTIVARGDAIQVKAGSQLNVEGGTIQSSTSINVWQGDSSLNVNNGTVNLTSGHIHLWDGAVTADFTDSTIGYGYDFIVGNAGNGVVMTVDNSTMSQSVASTTAKATVNSGNLLVVENGSVINLGEAGMGVYGTGLASAPGAALEVYGSAINGNISGSDGVDAITIDVDSVLNGTVSGVENINITGISSLATDINGVKAIAGEIDNILAGATIENQTANANGIFQLAGADNTIGTADDVWAGIGTDASGDTLVAWGTSESFVSETLSAFESKDLAIGDTFASAVADSSSIGDDANKKNNSNGTLA